jgi:hypothetical protein
VDFDFSESRLGLAKKNSAKCGTFFFKVNTKSYFFPEAMEILDSNKNLSIMSPREAIDLQRRRACYWIHPVFGFLSTKDYGTLDTHLLQSRHFFAMRPHYRTILSASIVVIHFIRQARHPERPLARQGRASTTRACGIRPGSFPSWGGWQRIMVSVVACALPRGRRAGVGHTGRAARAGVGGPNTANTSTVPGRTPSASYWYESLAGRTGRTLSTQLQCDSGGRRTNNLDLNKSSLI